jgi:hypothetical protein
MRELVVGRSVRMTSVFTEVGTYRERGPFSQVLIIAKHDSARQFSASCSRIRQK